MTRDRFRGALLGGLLGDAFGSVLEGISQRDSRLEPMVARRRCEQATWRYSDDTEMAMGVARSLVQRGCFDGPHLMRTFSENYEPARGYGRGMKLSIEAWRAGAAIPASAAWGDGSNGSGAAVRVIALACLLHRDLPALETAAIESARLTHRGANGVAGCALYARSLALVLRHVGQADIEPRAFVAAVHRDDGLGEKVSRLPTLMTHPIEQLAQQLGNGVTADESVPLALLAFLRWMPDFESVVVNTARCGGDVDTIASMSGALAGAAVGASKLPARWLANAEGVEVVSALADELFEMFKAGPLEHL